MTDRKTCPDCLRPVASEDDWRDVPEGQGAELCWGTYDCAERARALPSRAELAALVLSIPLRVAGETTHHFESDRTGPHLEALDAMQRRLR